MRKADPAASPWAPKLYPRLSSQSEWRVGGLPIGTPESDGVSAAPPCDVAASWYSRSIFRLPTTTISGLGRMDGRFRRLRSAECDGGRLAIAVAQGCAELLRAAYARDNHERWSNSDLPRGSHRQIAIDQCLNAPAMRCANSLAACRTRQAAFRLLRTRRHLSQRVRVQRCSRADVVGGFGADHPAPSPRPWQADGPRPSQTEPLPGTLTTTILD